MNKKNYMSPSTGVIYLKAKHCLLSTSSGMMNVNATSATEKDDIDLD